MSILRFLLFPFSVLYNMVTRVRNHLYNIGYKHQIEFNRAVISVGNLNVGGSGKTPMIEYLIRLLQTHYRLATLSRGYGRKTKGVRLAGTEDTARTIGDEPFQYFRKFGNEVCVTVGEDRALGITEILFQQPDTRVILLDDAFQHRAVKPGFSILLTEYRKPFFKDFVLPMGLLREARSGADRADVIIVTKCPAATSQAQRDEFRQGIHRYAKNKTIFFSSIRYGTPQPINGKEWQIPLQVVIVSGIAQSKIFEAHLRSLYNVVKHFEFPDHHFYARQHIQQIHNFCRLQSQPTSIITTEKDMVRLLPFREELTFAWFYIPIEMIFIENGSEFDTLIHKAIQS